MVGERGYRFSGGERQRLTIARLLLAQPRVVILDEATAHLDSTSEQAVQEALAGALAGRTLVRYWNFRSFMQAGQFVQVIEESQGLKIGAIEETAFKMKFIDKNQLNKLAEPL